MAVVLDSGVVVGFLDRRDTLHAAADGAIRDLVRKQQLLVSTVTYAEVLTGARIGHHDEDQVKGFFNDLVSEVLPVDTEVADVAAALRCRAKSLRMPDALILATAETHSDVESVVTGDARLSKLSGLSRRIQLLR